MLFRSFTAMFVSDLDYWSHRAEREAVAAASAGDHQIARLHEELSRLYTEQVLRGLGKPAAATRA